METEIQNRSSHSLVYNNIMNTAAVTTMCVNINYNFNKHKNCKIRSETWWSPKYNKITCCFRPKSEIVSFIIWTNNILSKKLDLKKKKKEHNDSNK